MSPLELQGVDQRWVPGDGPTPAKLAYIAEAPGMNEVRQGRPLVGPSGAVNWFMAARYGRVGREGAYVTNWSKLPMTDEYKKKGIPPEDQEAWDQLLQWEMADVKPEVVVLLGQYAVTSMLGDQYNTYWTNGIPVRRDGVVYIPVVHPAAGFHSPDKLADTMHGYIGVREYFEGKRQAREWGDWAPDPVVQVLDGRWLCPCELFGPPKEMAIDTEGLKHSPYCLTFSVRGWQAWAQSQLIWAGDEAAIRSFKGVLEEHRPVLILQNAVHDAGVIRKMTGINIWDYEVRDTLVYSFNLQDIPRDLKNMSRRFLSMDMIEYQTLVEPWRVKADDEWRARLAELAYKRVHDEIQYTPKGKVRLSKGKPVVKRVGEPLILSTLTHLERNQQLPANEVAWAETQIGRRPGLDLKLVPNHLAIPYAGKDSAVTLALEPILRKRIEDEGLSAVSEIDHAVLPMIEEMQNTGLHMDMERYWEVLGDVSTRRREVIKEIQQLVNGEGFNSPEFNPASGDQVAAFCKFIYERDRKLHLTKLTKSRKREATDGNSLSQLKDEHPFINLELEFKELDKYEGTYLLPMKDYVREVSPGEWRVFFNLRSTTVVSGRLSAHAPNVLAWPARTKLGLRLRSIFTAPPGLALASWDLSQIELRLAAWDSQDAVMLDAFIRGLDLHANLASKLFARPYEEIMGSPDAKLKYRTPTKTIHYLLLYGGGGDKLFEELRGMGITAYSRDDCFDLIADTWRIYSGVKARAHAVAQTLREKGYVQDFLGRRRFLPGAQLSGEWPMKSLRLESERQGLNFLYQGGAAELLKRSMRTVREEVYPGLRKEGIHFKLWLQVHDELFGELDPKHFDRIDRMMRAAMTQDSWMTAPIPIETEGKMGASWGELK